MNKQQLIEAISNRTGISKADAERALNAFTDIVTETLVAGDEVAIIGFGTYATSKRAARQVRNPQTGEMMEVAAANAVKFKVGKKLKDAVNQ